MSSDGILLFGNDNGGGAGSTSDYVKDEFLDVSLPASNNLGLTSTISTNPLGGYFANSLSPQYALKTLWIKDLERVENRSLWINNKPTFKIIWQETFPGAQAYCYGDVTMHGTDESRFLTFNGSGDGFGVTGVFRRVMWNIMPQLGTATAQQSVDGVNTTVLSFGPSSIATDGYKRGVYNPMVHSATDETHALHDFRIVSVQPGKMVVQGVMVYAAINGGAVETFGGYSYLDKTKTLGFGGSLAIPGVSSVLGGVGSVYLKQDGSFGYTTSLIPSQSSFATGANGTNLVNVNTGLGGSFPIGTVIWAPQGATQYLGAVTNVSTDTLTVAPTLSFGLSATITSLLTAGSTYAISSTLFEIDHEYLPSMQRPGTPGVGFTGRTIGASASIGYFDPVMRYSIGSQLPNVCIRFAYGNSLTIITGQSLNVFQYNPVGGQTIGLDFTQVVTPGNAPIPFSYAGKCAALEFEFTTGLSAVLAATFVVDGLVVGNLSETFGTPSIFKRTIISSGGMGYHQVTLFGAGSTQIMLSRVTAYRPKAYNGPSLGLVAELPISATFISPNIASGASIGPAGATLSGFGNISRYYASELPLYNRGVTNWLIGDFTAVAYGATTSFMQMQFFGRGFAFSAESPVTGYLANLDGASIGASVGVWYTGFSNTFHTLTWTNALGVTNLVGGIAAVDILCDTPEVRNKLNYDQLTDYSKVVRCFDSVSFPRSSRTGDIWVEDSDRGVAYQRMFGGWQRMNINQPGCVYGSALTQNIPDNFAGADYVGFPAQFEQRVWDPYNMSNGSHLTATFVITVPSDGIYMVGMIKSWAASSTGQRIIALNFGYQGQGSYSRYLDFVVGVTVSNGTYQSGSIITPFLPKGSAIIPGMFQTSGATLASQADPNASNFWCMRMGP